jgi:hypothetical protein
LFAKCLADYYNFICTHCILGDDGVDGEQWQLVAVTQVLQVGQIISALHIPTVWEMMK